MLEIEIRWKECRLNFTAMHFPNLALYYAAFSSKIRPSMSQQFSNDISFASTISNDTHTHKQCLYSNNLF